jgi:ABC-type branched-subunit amino acid transport system substrate-binding protein
MLRLKPFRSACLLLLFTFSSLSYATEIDLIYNISGRNAIDSRDAWHGARIAKQELREHGNKIDLVLYNGQSVDKLNAAIGKMRAASPATSIVIGLGNDQQMAAAAKPLLAAGKIFVAASNVPGGAKKQMGEHFFAVSPNLTPAQTVAAIHFENKYIARFHKKPTIAALYGYNAVMLAAAALSSSPDQSPAHLTQALKKLTKA